LLNVFWNESMKSKLFAVCLLSVVSFLPVVGGLVSSVAAQQTWTQWGGDNGRGFSVADVKLSDSPELTETWTRDLGSGYSGILVEGDRLFTHFRDGDDEVVISLNAESGETVWEHRYLAALPEDADESFGEGPNSTSIIVGDYLVSIGFLGDMKCFSKDMGDLKWETSLWKDHRSTELGFGYSASPLVYNDKIILPIGGAGKTIMAFNVNDGSVAWSALDYQISYASPLLISVGGVDQLVLSLTDSVIGVNANDGSELWSFELKNQWDTHAFVPVWNKEDNQLFISSFRQSHLLRLSSEGDSTSYEPVWSINNTGIGFTNAVRVGDVVYGTTGGSSSPLMTAFDVNEGKVLWKERGFDVTNFLAVGDKLMLLDAKGQLAIAAPTPESLNVTYQKQVLDSDKGWTYPTLVGNRLFVRNQKQIAAFQMK